MKFILNTSFDPHFCALLDEDNQIIAKQHWQIPREDGQHLWAFLNQHLQPSQSLSFIGGISGPGSFSSLRTAGAVLNALSFKFNIPIHSARADYVIQDYLKTTPHANERFVLNSFSQRIFTIKNNQLTPVDLELNTFDSENKVITSWLPESKANHFKNSVQVDPLGPIQTLITTLESQSSQPHFIPDYEYPAVQT